MDFGTNKILITGANGWLGKSLVNALVHGIQNSPNLVKPNKNLEIKCLIIPGEDTTYLESLSSNVSTFNGDVTKEKDCTLFTEYSKNAILFHCAGIIHPKRTKQFFEINVNSGVSFSFSFGVIILTPCVFLLSVGT